MSCEYVREYYGVSAEISRRIKHNGRLGIITEDRGHYIGVNFDDCKPGVVVNVHPTDDVEYLEMGNICKMTKAQQRYQKYLKEADCWDSFLDFLKGQTLIKNSDY